MVTIIDYQKYEAESGNEYIRLILQGDDLTIVMSESGKFYAKAAKSSLISAISEEVAKHQIGKKLPGIIEKVEVEPFTYVSKETGEEKVLNYRYRYNPNRDTLVPEEEAVA